jgi:hypothetical protein
LENVLQNASLPCVPCYKSQCAYRDPLACLKLIDPAIVFDKARQQLAGEVGCQMKGLFNGKFG